MAKVTYLDNAGFIVKTDRVFYVFDYYRDPAHRLVKELEQNPELPVIFFASSPHTSHYNDEIFNLAQNHKRVYVMANQVVSRIGDTVTNAVTLTAGDKVEDIENTDTTVQAFGSTESGVSFVVKTSDGKVILFGGDLSPYHLDEDKKSAQAVENKFKTVVDRIAAEYSEVDLAFLSVDPTATTDYAEGARYLVEKINVKNFIPMHYHGKVNQACDFRTYNMPATVETKFHGFRNVGQELTIKL